MFTMILGSAYFAWLAGTVTGILSSSSAGNERFLGFFEEVRQYLDVYRFSSEIKSMVYVFYRLKFPTKHIFEEDQIMESLPSGLQKKMRVESYLDLIDGIPIFSELSEATKAEICNHMSTQLCSAQEELCTQGAEPENLFILRHGEVLLLHNGNSIGVVRPGEMFGELSLLHSSVSRFHFYMCILYLFKYIYTYILMHECIHMRAYIRTGVCINNSHEPDVPANMYTCMLIVFVHV